MLDRFVSPRRDLATLCCLGAPGPSSSSSPAAVSSSLKPDFAGGVENLKCCSLARMVCEEGIEQSNVGLRHESGQEGGSLGQERRVRTASLTDFDVRRRFLRSLWFTLQKIITCEIFFYQTEISNTRTAQENPILN